MNQAFQSSDSADFMKRIWAGWAGGMNLPSLLTPTLDLEEIDRRINELKTVEHWLNVNLNMLRNTIQGMEVQRGTLAALQSFGASFAQQTATQAHSPDASNTPEAPDAQTNVDPSAQEQFSQALQQGGHLWWDMLQQQFNQIANTAAQNQAQAAAPSPATDAPATSAATPSTPAVARAPRQGKSAKG